MNSLDNKKKLPMVIQAEHDLVECGLINHGVTLDELVKEHVEESLPDISTKLLVNYLAEAVLDDSARDGKDLTSFSLKELINLSLSRCIETLKAVDGFIAEVTNSKEYSSKLTKAESFLIDSGSLGYANKLVPTVESYLVSHDIPAPLELVVHYLVELVLDNKPVGGKDITYYTINELLNICVGNAMLCLNKKNNLEDDFSIGFTLAKKELVKAGHIDYENKLGILISEYLESKGMQYIFVRNVMTCLVDIVLDSSFRDGRELTTLTIEELIKMSVDECLLRSTPTLTGVVNKRNTGQNN